MSAPSLKQLADKSGLPETSINEAMEWLVLSWSGENDAGFDRALESWLTADPSHRQAWHYLNNVSQRLNNIPAAVATNSLRSAEQVGSRRRFLQVLGMLLLGVCISPLLLRHKYSQALMADLRTGTGDIKRFTLPDGTGVVLNTETAVDLVFDQQLRQINLIAGEIFIETAPDPINNPQSLPRPFVVKTDHGSVQPIGTEFSVRHTGDQTIVAVEQGAVIIRNAQTQRKLSAGEAAGYDAQNIQSTELNYSSDWVESKLAVKQIPLATFCQELGRYRPGFIRVHPDLVAQKLSGRFDLQDTDRTLALLEQALPIKVSFISPYWVNIDPE